MTGLLRALAGLLPAPWFIYAPGAHFGNIVQPAPADEACDDCDCADPDGPEPVLVLMPIASAAELFTEAGIRCRNGDDPDTVGWEMARTLELGDIDA